ncbi:DUF5986 family protein [Latilactobacillus curvatus]
MDLNPALEHLFYSVKDAFEVDLAAELQAAKALIVTNPEDPYNSESRTKTDMRISNVISNIKYERCLVQTTKYRATNYPIIFDKESKTAVMLFKLKTIKTAGKSPNHFIWHACSAINGISNNRNNLGQGNLFNVRIERLDDPIDNNIAQKLFGGRADDIEQLLIFCYEVQHGVATAFVREYDGLGKIMDELEIVRPVHSPDPEEILPDNPTEISDDPALLKVRIQENQNIKIE